MRSCCPSWRAFLTLFGALLTMPGVPAAQELSLQLAREIEPPIRRGAIGAAPEAGPPRVTSVASATLPASTVKVPAQPGTSAEPERGTGGLAAL